jgi:hypothetical protein
MRTRAKLAHNLVEHSFRDQLRFLVDKKCFAINVILTFVIVEQPFLDLNFIACSISPGLWAMEAK